LIFGLKVIRDRVINFRDYVSSRNQSFFRHFRGGLPKYFAQLKISQVAKFIADLFWFFRVNLFDGVFFRRVNETFRVSHAVLLREQNFLLQQSEPFQTYLYRNRELIFALVKKHLFVMK
jgi:hypothetical protein